MIYRHYIIYGDYSDLQAMATECAGEQDAFWRFYDRLYRLGPVNRQRMPNLADNMGLDVPRFTACLDDQRYRQTIDEDIEYARALDVSAVPTILIVGAGEYIQIVGGFSPSDLGGNFDRLLARLEDQ